MDELPTLRIGGVPEHFNYPWHLALERGLFEKNGVKVQWVDQPLGTGQMITSVREVRTAQNSNSLGVLYSSLKILLTFLKLGVVERGQG